MNKKFIIFVFVFFAFNIYAIDEDFYDLGVDFETKTINVYDPFKSVNSAILDFNLFALKYIGQPINNTYKFIFPIAIRRGFNNVLNNLQMPFNFVNSLLIFNFKNAEKSFSSFLINSTFGLFGLFDMAKMKVKKTTFDDTFSFYGIPSGPYLMIPILGPNTLRGSISDLLSFYVDPFGYNSGYPLLDNNYYLIKSSLNGVNQIYFTIENYYDLIMSSFDKYTFVRDAFIQNKEFNNK
jgi:phospholipid-binding lipoprotein MlaA